MEALYGAVALVLGGVFVAFAGDRYPRWTRVMTAFGLLAIFASLVWFSLLHPVAPVITVAALMSANWALAFGNTLWAVRTKPANSWAMSVWRNEMETLLDLGWRHLGTWVVDGGQTQPAFTIFERPHDGTRVGMIGTAPQGGVISIDTLLDDGRGLMVTLRDRSVALKPAWMFRQELPGSLDELIRAHDDALFLLQTRGITPGGTVPGPPLEFEQYTAARIHRHVVRRWWLWALRPIVRRLAPSTRQPLHEQRQLDGQIDRYQTAIHKEPSLLEA